MILADHNIPRAEIAKLRRRRIRAQQVGYDVGRPEWKDAEEILRFLRSHRGVTFLTRDLGFYRRRFAHGGNSIVVVTGRVLETAELFVRFLRQPLVRTRAQRAGRVFRVSPDKITWLDKDRQGGLDSITRKP